MIVHVQEFVESSSEDEADGREDGYHEGHEVYVILDTNTIVNPRAVVVKPFHAAIACAAVPAPWRPDHQAIGAQLDRIDKLH